MLIYLIIGISRHVFLTFIAVEVVKEVKEVKEVIVSVTKKGEQKPLFIDWTLGRLS
jgi:hypothetical protein